MNRFRDGLMDTRVVGIKDEIINGTSDFELYAPAIIASATLQHLSLIHI